MNSATRQGDATSGVCSMGFICCPHERIGTNDFGSPNVFINGRSVQRAGDGGMISCPHGGAFISIGASGTVFANGKGITRVGDGTICINCGCDGNHISGSTNVFIGG